MKTLIFSIAILLTVFSINGRAELQDEIKSFKAVSVKLNASQRAKAQKYFKGAFDLLQSKEPGAAAIQFEKGLKIDPANVMAQYWVGEAYRLSGKNELSIVHYRYVQELDSKSKESALASDRLNSIQEKVGDFEPQLLQIGSFSNVDDAEMLKSKLALLGIDAYIKTMAIPDKGVWYRVKSGPYKSADDLSRMRGYLKQNGIDSTPMRAQ